MEGKFDLSMGEVTLDYQELVKTAKIAVGYSLRALHSRLGDWGSLSKLPTSTNAEWMLRDAKALATATLALHVLSEGLSRDKVIIANKPPVANED